MTKLLSPKILLILFIVFLTFHIFALINHWYFDYIWLDIPMHLIGGFLSGLLVVFLLRRYSHLLDSANDGDVLFMIWGGVALIGILWEFQEFFFDLSFTTKLLQPVQPNSMDTLKDLADDLLGAFIAFLVIRSKTVSKIST